jgi:small conductance mechanosensitive channel
METINYEIGTISNNIIEAADTITDVKMWDKILEKAIAFGIKFACAILIFVIGTKIINIIRKLVRKALDRRDTEVGVKQFLDSFIKAALYVVLFCILAGFYGIQTASLMTILGSAGVAIALALQGSLSNFTGGVLILILKPFKVGDYIKEDNKNNEGFVQEITLFYTKLRTRDNKLVILPNGTLANTSMTNVSALPELRVSVSVGISYESDIKKAKDIIRRLIKEDDRVILDMGITIFVEGLDESQVTIVARYFVKNDDYYTSANELREEIKESFDREGIVIPFNQLDIHMKNDV